MSFPELGQTDNQNPGVPRTYLPQISVHRAASSSEVTSGSPVTRTAVAREGRLFEQRTRPDAVRGDKAYSSRAIRGHLGSRKIKAVIPEPDDQKGHRKRRGSRGGRPVGLDAADYRNRNVVERSYCHLKQWRGLATRYDKHAVIYRAAVLLNAVVVWTRHLVVGKE
ncbi:transposase [uncultured Microbacterium sp.]|uniref:transposase n=1 Tax=uncultured Microbacterium sp. TaxID=191216 RepID=UPI0025FB6394|nr:transposase [uncultured Microbacterium sp.]